MSLATRTAPMPTLRPSARPGSPPIPSGRSGLVWAAGAASLAALGLAGPEWTQFAVTGVAVGAGTLLAISGRIRARESVLWLAVLVGVLNFAPTLLNAHNLNDQALWTRVVKDIPLLLCLVVGATCRPLGRPRAALTYSIVGLAAVLVAEIALQPQAAASTAVSLRYYLAYPLLAVAVARMELTVSERQRLLRLILMLGVLEGGLAVGQYMGLAHTYYAGSATIGSGYRATGTLGNPNNFGLFLGLPALILLAQLEQPGARFRMVSIGAVLLVLAGVGLSFSKTAGVALGIASLVQSRRIRGRGRWILAVVLLGSFFFLAVHGRPQGVRGLLGTRPSTNAVGLAEWTSSPLRILLGEGIGSQQQLGDNAVVVSTGTDDMALTLAVEGGLLLLLAMGAVVLVGLRVALRARGPDVPLLGFAVYFLLYTAVSLNLRLYPGAFLFWVCLGLVEGAARAEEAPRPGPSAAPSSIMRGAT